MCPKTVQEFKTIYKSQSCQLRERNKSIPLVCRSWHSIAASWRDSKYPKINPRAFLTKAKPQTIKHPSIHQVSPVFGIYMNLPTCFFEGPWKCPWRVKQPLEQSDLSKHVYPTQWLSECTCKLWTCCGTKSASCHCHLAHINLFHTLKHDPCLINKARLVPIHKTNSWYSYY